MATDVIAMMKEVGAVMTDDHFVGTSGKHFATYINKDALYPYTTKTSQVCAMFADEFHKHEVEVVVGPALGGIILSQWTAAHLGMMHGKPVLGVYAEKKNDVLTLTRGYDQLVKGKRVAVVEDLTTTGGSLKQVIEVVKAAGGEVVVSGVIINKNPKEVNSEFFGVPFVALAEMPIDVFEADACPYCANGIPVNTKIGHGAKFVAAQGK